MRLSVLLIIVALLGGCGKKQTGNLAIDSSLVPPDTAILTGVRVDAVRKSPLYQKYANGKNLPSLDGFIAEYGLDPRSDIDEIVGASNGKSMLLIARGNFASVKVKQRENLYFSTIDEHLAVAGPEQLVKAAIAQRNSGHPLPERLQPLVQSIPQDAQSWAVSGGGFDLKIPERSNLQNLGNILGALDSFSAWADLSKGLRIGADGHCVDEASAKKLQTQVRGLIGLGRLNTPDNQPQLLKAFDAIEVKQDGRSLHLGADLGMDLIESLIKQLESLHPSRP